MSFEVWLMISVVTGAFGLAYFVYGKKQSKIVPLASGIALMVYPYFIDSLLWSIVIGVVLLAVPFVIEVD